MANRQMVTQILLLLAAICSTLAAPGDVKHLCSSLRPAKNLSLDKLAGHWITLNELMFKDGVAAAPSTRQGSLNDTGVRHNQCVHHEVTLLTGQQPRLSWSPFFSFLRGHESRGGTFIVADRANGRWRLLEQDGRSMQGGRMLVLDGDPETYIVRAMCFPDATASTGKTGKRSPLVLKSITVESRRKPDQNGRGALGAEQMIQVKTKVARLLGLTEFKPAQFGLFC